MKILCKSGIVKSRRVGSWNYYSINEDGCEYASRLLTLVAKKQLHTILAITGFVHRFFHMFRKSTVEQMPTVENCCSGI